MFMNFLNCSCMIFWTQNASILPDQNVSILFVSNIYILGILEQFGTENYA